jgi:hypothetical protein
LIASYPYFPGLAWRFPRLAHGAVIARLDRGAIQERGLAERYIVIAIGGRDVVDARSFARIVGEERALLAERGGALRLLVQTASGDPREFSTTIIAKPVDGPRHGTPGNRPAGRDSGAGGIHVWDRVGGPAAAGATTPRSSDLVRACRGGSPSPARRTCGADLDRVLALTVP